MTTKITLNNIADTALATLTGPKVTTIVYPGTETATDVVGGATINLTGGGFQSGCSVLVASTASSVVTFISSTQISFIAPALSAGTYVIYVINPDGGTAISIPGISYSGTPNWTTTAGSLGNAYETGAISTTLTATGDSPITYTLATGTLPTGSTLASNGTISGTAQATASATTYSFTVTAKDAQNQTTNRSFSLTINPDVVTWSSPTASATYNVGKDSVMANVTMSATSAAGGSITYTADTLPTGLSITGANIAGTPTVAASTTTTLTATATSTRAATRIINWVVSVGGDTYWKNTMLLLSGNGTNNAQNNTFVDSSPNNYTITRGGSPGQGTFSPYGPNWSNYFNGGTVTGDYLTIPSNSALAAGSGDFTLELWLNISSAPSNIAQIYDTRPASTNGAYTLLYLSADRIIRLWVSAADRIASSALNINTWYHIAVVRNSATTTMYVNGVSAGTWADSSNYLQAGAYIGASYSGGGSISNFINGYISNVRMVKGTAVYTSNFTPSITPLTAIPNTSLLTCQSNRFIDNSTNAFAVTNNGNVSVERLSPFNPTQPYSDSTIGGSARFDGVGDYITIPYTGDPTGNFTIEFWWFPLTFAPNYQEIFTKGIGIQVFAGGATMSAAFTSANASPYYLNAAFGTAILNSWNHIVVVKNSTTYTGYVNGVGTVIGTSSSVPGTGGNPVSIGYYGPGPGYYTSGYISNARYVVGTAVYTANFNPPTSPVTAIANTQLLCNFTNAGIIDSTMQNYVITVGEAKISTTQSRFGGSSIYFDGTGDYLLSAPLAANVLGNIDFTIEFWLYPSNTSSAYRALVSSENYATTTGGWSLYQNGTGIEFWLSPGGSVTLNATSAIIASTWQHLALCRASGTLRLFINGTSVASVANSTSLTGQQIWIGDNNSGSYFYNGYIDDLRITKGIARYTSNFTAPVSAFATK